MNKQISYKIVSVVFGILVLCFAIAFYAVGWTEPQQAPPGCTPGQPGCDAPVNVGPTSQTKAGNLVVNALGVSATGNALLVPNGNVGIGTPSPGYKLDVNGAFRLQPSSAPTAANGVMYYDSGTNKFRCYQNGAWTDCIGVGAGGGDITDVNGGSGLLPDTCSSGSCTLNVNTGATLTTGLEIVSDQVRLMDDGCVAGEVLKRNAANNGWECVPDNNAGLTCNTKTGTFNTFATLSCDPGYTAVLAICNVTAIWTSDCSLAGMCGLTPNADAATGMCWRMAPGTIITPYLRCCK